ncbi:proline iminopeptidase-family hydrolase [Halopenitus persicus]|uniref:Proline iminopeptidase n=1 Tax=Halopenitus persicus TaxID=1048396 RepID=A0A1H3JVB1_9EURY|nr:proline iminopeptidase-family hydrolase [Halopenitus persicus]QHS15756.1 proline iminopeptidase-family hydrolase [haloarchaeon 3A1-DGR]SDY43278.1 tricorn interacting aminopeptidase F1. Serine peptidase. MEROPS family S33 [Halopenitus persicus]
MTEHPAYFETHDHGEGYFEIDDYELYYRRFGSGDDVLVGVHGGPGMPHDYLAPLAEHAGEDLTVYLYDQFGVGRSDGPAPGDFDRYTVDHYRGELEAVRKAIDPEGSFTLYGQSWGGMLAQEYVLEHGAHVDGLMLANTLADTQTAFESMRSVLDELPADDRATIEDHEAERAYDAPAYEAALDGAYREHVCRTEEYPDPVLSTFDRISLDVYGLMWGPNEYVLLDTARLRDWDVRDRLPEVDVPTLVLSGEYDEIDPEIARDIADRIPNADVHVFEESSHMPFWETPDAHYEVVESFLAELRSP